MSWEIIFETEQLLAYWHGLLTTLSLLLSSLGIGAVLAVACALALTNGPWVLQKLVGSFTYFVRGTPLLIQVYLIYYGLAQLDWIQERWDAVWPWTHFKEPFFCALLAFALNTGGYTAEMLAGAIRETDPGEVEAARAMGMGRWQIMRPHRAAQRHPPHPAALQQRGGDDAALHQPGQHRPGADRHHRRGQPDLLGLLPAV